MCVCVYPPGPGLVQKVVYSGEGAGSRTDAGHELDTLSGLAQSQHQGGLPGQVLGLCQVQTDPHRHTDTRRNGLGASLKCVRLRDV